MTRFHSLTRVSRDFDNVPLEVARFNKGRDDHERLGPLGVLQRAITFMVLMGGKVRIGCEDLSDLYDGCLFLSESEFMKWKRDVKHTTTMRRSGGQVKKVDYVPQVSWLMSGKSGGVSTVQVRYSSLTQGILRPDEYNIWTGWEVEPEPGDWGVGHS